MELFELRRSERVEALLYILRQVGHDRNLQPLNSGLEDWLATACGLETRLTAAP
jgi:hypothetical protein